MREIKFRGKRIDIGKWIYGYVQLSGDKSSAWICESKEDDWTVRNQFPIDPKTVGQYTGLTDQAGIEIFEGDIAKSKRGAIGIIKSHPYWAAYYFSTVLGHDEDGKLVPMISSVPMWNDWGTLVVIGNIHEHPHLLEDTQGEDGHDPS